MYLIIDYQCTSVIYCTFLITGKKPSIVSIVMLYHLSLLLHVHSYYVQLCLFYHTAAISFVSHFYCIIYAILTRIAITPYTIVYNNDMQVSWCICLHYYTICIFFFEKKIYFIQKKTNRQKIHIYFAKSIYTYNQY